ncbi:MAG: HPF/RaiA family ribosome-associated protein [Aureliella sp.]
MQLPLQISFRGMERSPEIEAMVWDKADRLDEFANRIVSCRVVIAPAGKHHEFGNQYEVRIDIKLPGGEVAVTHEPGRHKEYRDVDIAIRDAFDAAVRQVEDYVRLQRGDVKSHLGMPHGRVSKLIPQADYGYLETLDGREVYFHRNSVLDDAFDELAVGTEVAFAEEQGDEGPQASTVKLVGRHSHLL